GHHRGLAHRCLGPHFSRAVPLGSVLRQRRAVPLVVVTVATRTLVAEAAATSTPPNCCCTWSAMSTWRAARSPSAAGIGHWPARVRGGDDLVALALHGERHAGLDRADYLAIPLLPNGLRRERRLALLCRGVCLVDVPVVVGEGRGDIGVNRATPKHPGALGGCRDDPRE